jgi:hypothetical protein
VLTASHDTYRLTKYLTITISFDKKITLISPLNPVTQRGRNNTFETIVATPDDEELLKVIWLLANSVVTVLQRGHVFECSSTVVELKL